MADQPSNVVGLPSREPFIDRERLAEALNVSLSTLDRWRKDPTFPSENWGPRTIRFQVGEVVKWLRQRDRREAA